jgi:hypothetical protein
MRFCRLLLIIAFSAVCAYAAFWRLYVISPPAPRTFQYLTVMPRFAPCTIEQVRMIQRGAEDIHCTAIAHVGDDASKGWMIIGWQIGGTRHVQGVFTLWDFLNIAPASDAYRLQLPEEIATADCDERRTKPMLELLAALLSRIMQSIGGILD